MKVEQLYYGGVPVPYTASWSAEEHFWVARFPEVAGKPLGIMQSVDRGSGKPQFGKPHAVRQRQVIAKGLCDLCAGALAGRTKVSLSHARAQPHGHKIGDILQVEPLLHKECAAVSMKHCPALRRDIQDGSLMVRHVTQFGVQFAMMSAEYVQTITGEHVQAIGHAKVHLQKWTDRDERWLTDSIA